MVFSALFVAQRRFGHWRHIYNHECPHQALDMVIPAEHLYQPGRPLCARACLQFESPSPAKRGRAGEGV